MNRVYSIHTARIAFSGRGRPRGNYYVHVYYIILYYIILYYIIHIMYQRMICRVEALHDRWSFRRERERERERQREREVGSRERSVCARVGGRASARFIDII